MVTNFNYYKAAGILAVATKTVCIIEFNCLFNEFITPCTSYAPVQYKAFSE